MPAQRLILIAPAVTMYTFDPVPADTVVIFGDADELIPSASMQQWADAQHLTVKHIPDAGHFFHGKLKQLQQAFIEACAC
jgi:hypothetical protein